MGHSRASAQEIREVEANFNNPAASGLAGFGFGSTPDRPKWLWGWVVVYIFLAILALTLVGLWVSAMGGVKWGYAEFAELMFNYHPLFMILGFIFFTGMASMIYRLFPNGHVRALEITHSILQLTALVLMCCGVYAVGFSKDYGVTPHVPTHFVSTHSWCGLTVLIFMAFQWVCGFFGFLIPGCKGERRAQYRRTHVFTGNVIFLVGCATVLIGIDQTSRANHYLNWLAMTVLAFGILGAWFLSVGYFNRGSREGPDATLDERAPLTLNR